MCVRRTSAVWELFELAEVVDNAGKIQERKQYASCVRSDICKRNEQFVQPPQTMLDTLTLRLIVLIVALRNAMYNFTCKELK